MRQYITAKIQAVSQSEIEGIVDPMRLKSIKASDPNPTIRVYSIGHEGNANLHLPGIGNKTFTWIQAAVQWIADKLSVGTSVFDRHNPNTNSHSGRTPIGEVVGRTVRTIGNRLNTLAAIYVYPQFKSRPLDVASIEAEIEYDHDEEQAWPTAIKNVSGVALSNSDIDTPGFPGASLLGNVQAYAVQAFAGEKGDKTMNQSEVKQAVKDLGLKPSDLFEGDALLADPAVDSKVKEKTKEHFAMSKRVGEERDILRDQIAKIENEKAELSKQVRRYSTQGKSASVMEAVLTSPDCKLNDKTKAFVNHRFKEFDSNADDDATLKADVVKFVNSSAKEFKELTNILGIKAEETAGIDDIPVEFTVAGQKTINTQDPKAGNADGTSNPNNTPPARETVLRAEMNPDVNPLIPGGKAANDMLKTT